MSKILIKNIKGLFQAGEQFPKFKKGAQMSEAHMIEHAFLAIEDDVQVSDSKMLRIAVIRCFHGI